ncbi:MAG: ATP synthase F0 subunit B [Deltaproteobacteria bacterium]|nr:ATP synthase F0 subunit B [Deltaproteobacteria bacterium]
MLRLLTLFLGLILYSPLAAASSGSSAINWVDFKNSEVPALLAVIVNFALLVILLVVFVRKPLVKALRDRRDKIEAAIREAERMMVEARATMAEAVARMDAMDMEMARIRSETLGAGKAESERIIAEAKLRSERMRADTSTAIEQEIARMAEALRAEIVEKVMIQAEAMVKEKAGPPDHERLAREYLASVDGKGETPSTRG